MADFEFDSVPTPGANRAAKHTDCPTCEGHRLVATNDEGTEYAPCPDCHPAAKPDRRGNP